MTYYFLNGIRNSRANTTGALDRYLREAGRNTQHLIRDRPTWPWGSWSMSYLDRTARHLIYQIKPEFGARTLIAHSQGCLQAYHMLVRWQRQTAFPLFDNIVMLAPAMNRSGWDWDELNFDKMLVIYNPDDIAIWLGSFLLLHPFGQAGVRGFKTDDERIIQQSDSSTADGFLGHNHYFDHRHIAETAQLVLDFCQKAD